MFKKQLMLGAILMGTLGGVNANESSINSPVYQFYLDHLVQRVTFLEIDSVCQNYSEEEKIDMAIEGLLIVTDSYLKERSLVEENLNLITERDTLVTRIEAPITFSCANITEAFDEFKQETLRRATWDFKYIEKVLNQ
jgi:hypothetical protein